MSPRGCALFCVVLISAACVAPAVDPEGKLCHGACPSPFLCGLHEGGGAPVCVRPPSRTQRCAASPHLCGFPDGTNVGVPTGVKLTRVPEELTSGPGWSWSPEDRDVIVTGAGATLERLDISGGLQISAADVTVVACRVQESDAHSDIVQIHDGADRVTLVDSTLGGVDAAHPTGGVTAGDSVRGLVLRRLQVGFVSTGFGGTTALIEDSYFHDMLTSDGSGAGVGGVASAGGRGGLELRHNSILFSGPGNCAVCLFQDVGAQTNATVDGNLLEGGGYCIYGGAGGKGQSSNIRIVNNRFGQLYSSTCGFYGPFSNFDETGPGNLNAGNVWDDDGGPLD